MNKSVDIDIPVKGTDAQTVTIVHEGEEGSSPQPIPQFQREPNRAERRRMERSRKPSWKFSKDGKLLHQKNLMQGAFGNKKRQWVTKLSADPHKWVEPVVVKALKKPRAKKIVPVSE